MKAVIFDFDGVLADTLPIMKQVYRAIGTELGIPEWTQLNGKLDSFSVDWHETCRRFGLSTAEDRKKVEEIYLREFKKIRHETKIFPGILDVVRQLKDVKKAILSNNVRAEIEKTLEREGLQFDSIVGGEDGKQKPDPELYSITMQRLGVDPNDVVYICDMKEEIVGAHNANIKKVIAVTYGYHSKEHLSSANPAFIVDTPQQIMETLREIQND